MTSRNTVLKAAGVALIVCSLAFVAVFTYLAGAFGYPDILDHGAAEVLPRLLAGGARLRVIWFVYSALPLGILFAGVGSAALLSRGGRALRALGLGAAIAASLAMIVGLLRWPTIEWTLARYWETGTTASQTALAAMFDASNLFLGNLSARCAWRSGSSPWRSPFGAMGVAWSDISGWARRFCLPLPACKTSPRQWRSLRRSTMSPFRYGCLRSASCSSATGDGADQQVKR